MRLKRFVALLSVLTCAVTSFSQVPQNQLIGYWPLEGSAVDQSGFGNNGVINGATPTTDRFGNIDGAFDFDGFNDFIRIPDDSILNPTNITISVWYKPVAFAGVGNNPILQKAYTSHSSPFYQYHVGVTGENYDSGGLRFASNLSVNSQRRILVADTVDFESDTWYMLTTTFDGKTMNMYVNDKLLESTAVTGDLDAYGQDIYIGKFGNQNLYTPGAVDDIVIYSRAIDSSEVVVLYNNGICTDTTVTDTTIFQVVNESFEGVSPQFQFMATDSLKAVGGCDSVVNRYAKYEFNPKVCTEIVYDTITVYDSIAVTDTLIIDVDLPTTGINGEMVNSLKIFPNPAKDFIIVNTGINYEAISDYSIEIMNTNGVVIFSKEIESSDFQVNIEEFAVTGLYYVRLFDNEGQLVHIRKLILE